MNLGKIEENIQKFVLNLGEQEFIYGLLFAYGQQKASLKRLKGECCYRANPFTNDEERAEYLFMLYEEMTSEKKKEAI